MGSFKRVFCSVVPTFLHYQLSSTTNCRIIADLLEIENHELVRVRQLSYEISIITISSTTLECVPTLNGERMKIELDSILEM